MTLTVSEISSHPEETVDNEAETVLRAYLQSMTVSEGCTHLSIQDYVLNRGRLFVSQRLTPREIGIVLEAARRAGDSFPQRYCFANAAKLVVSDTTGELQYVEGFAVGTIMPVHHAWVVIRDKVVDLTWRNKSPAVLMRHRYAENILGVIPPGRAYMGLQFPREEVLKRLADTETKVSFLDGHEGSLPLFKSASASRTG